MKTYSGKSVYKGIAMGKVVLLKDRDQQVKRYRIEDADSEIARVHRAGETARKQLQGLYDKALKEVGETNAAIFEVHQMMLEDDDYLESIQNMIQTEMVNAEYAVAVTGDNFSEMFAGMDDDYMKARAADVKDISNRLVKILQGQEEVDFSSMEPSIIVADDLSPSETVQMDKEKILAFVTVHGSTNSHTAILARMMNIPALIGVPMELQEIHNGMEAVVDGFQGEVIFEPSEEICGQTKSRIKEEKEKAQLLQTLKGKETITLDGRKVNLYANIANVGDVGYVLENDAEGIGLFRSEFLYLGKTSFPTEEEQFRAYKQVVQMMAGKKVIIRTLDIGADKQVDYLNLGQEDNPAMGYRAIRICLKQPEMFKTQLRALFRAAVFGNISVMYPMITSVEEVRQIYGIVKEVQEELDSIQIPYKIPEQGIMIETPAAVMISDELAEIVDFFSIGTNDLTQYTLAVDRQNAKLDDFYNPHHKAILKMIRMVVDNAHKCGKWAGICGELGADLELTEEFVRMGVDELSVAPSMALKVRKRIREIKDSLSHPERC
ncbi:MAG: phosphoenolpyruvate--protein phosphotransferase [Eubacterium sp.]|nr:phosphoenolpyruvate--protein phosphotransferase [Eubacterium sp.]